MKTLKLILALVACVMLGSCTKQSMVKKFGGTMTVKLPKGQKLMMATWKESDLFYLTEPMDSDYTPKTKTFQEDSKWGVAETKVLFVEEK